ncbi:cation efflux protein [Neurospora hispaniola]|uniref:Cation efflux protein n=1 Tax=Neurospora hispaniola TaxID=588809 RepID=A0AAJ0IBK2_9PEZI|nr:cation efflux protein [Neurospora hispaniola]
MAWSKTTRIQVMLAIDVMFFLLELSVGLAVGSLALLADSFHMLNDIISLLVGLWALSLTKRATTDQFSYGWLRAEILGAFFNAVFLIALCVSIVLEALGRFINPPTIDNPKLILIVGSLGLASNLVGFVVLGGHGHSHGPGGHDHGHDEHTHGHADAHEHNHGYENSAVAEEGRAGAASDAHSHQTGRARKSSNARHARFTSIEDMQIYPASFRQEIIEASRSQPEESSSENSSDNENGGHEDTNTENTPLIGGSNGHNHQHYGAHSFSSKKGRRNSNVHREHNHTKPKKASKGGHGHSHADMGMNAMVLHVIGDALGNVGVIATALIIWLTNWPGRFYADPAVSLFITVIILRSAIPLTLAASKILLQATPEHIDLKQIREDIQDLEGVVSCHHVHVWQLDDTSLVASLHIQVDFPISAAGGDKYMELSRQVRQCLHEYGIHSATIQPEFCLDMTHNHTEEAATSPRPDDSSSSLPGCGKADGKCLLACVEDCSGRGCCVVPGVSRPESAHSHDGDGHHHH